MPDPRPAAARMPGSAAHGHASAAGAEGFGRCNLHELALEPTVAHGGEGTILFRRILTAADVRGACTFADYSVVPPGASVGEHTHAPDEEEYYLILAGAGRMRRNGEEFAVRAGDLVRNPPGGTHMLVNTGEGDLRMFVFELRVAG